LIKPPAAWSGAGSLVIANLATIVMAVAFDWPAGVLLWPYWLQSLVIGWYNRKRLLALQEFSTANLTMNDKPVAATPATQRQVAQFFVLHYGGFHLAYLFVLLPTARMLSAWDFLGIAVAAGTFLANHRHSYRANIAADARGKPNIATLMFLPYLRVLPMHLIIIVGGKALGTTDSSGLIVLFGLLKTCADVAMHFASHHLLRRHDVRLQPVRQDQVR